MRRIERRDKEGIKRETGAAMGGGEGRKFKSVNRNKKTVRKETVYKKRYPGVDPYLRNCHHTTGDRTAGSCGGAWEVLDWKGRQQYMREEVSVF